MSANTSAKSATSNPPGRIVNVSAYLFVPLGELETRRTAMRDYARRLGIRGTILLSPEGINLFLAAERAVLSEFLDWLRSDPAFAELAVKESLSDYQPFSRMLVKVKQEIIAFGIPEASPLHAAAPKLPAAQLRQWLDEGRKVHLLDTRNDYEVEVGTFRDAVPIGVDHFRDFPSAVEKLPEDWKEEPVVMFCTGGIRCEKAGPYMQQAGFRQVYQLDGGILKYFEDCGGKHYDGDCFVFDHRVAVNSALLETGHEQCFICQAVVPPEDQQSDVYVPGVSCPSCFQDDATRLTQRLAQRQAEWDRLTQVLPGSEPALNHRPLNVPHRYDGWKLLEFLADWHPEVPQSEWRERIEECRIVPAQQHGRRRRKRTTVESLPLSEDRIVRAGERLEHLIVSDVEPPVSADVRFLYEDADLLVVDKPAPLPLHASGRFHRNTLQYLLNQVYSPERPYIVHRLDANTTGVLLLTRRKSVTRAIGRVFEQRKVEKTYLAKVQGHPNQDEFTVKVPISAAPGPGGVRIPDANGRDAETFIRVLRREDDGTAIVRAYPVTGRTNQIRLHLWLHGFPIVGDPAYPAAGVTDQNKTLTPEDPPLCLHAESLKLHDHKGQPRLWTSPPPAWCGHAVLPAVDGGPGSQDA